LALAGEDLAYIEPYLPAHSGTKPSPVIQPVPPGNPPAWDPARPQTWDWNPEIYAEEIPGWVKNWHINEHWIHAAEFGLEPHRRQIFQDIAWYRDNGTLLPWQLDRYVVRFSKRLAHGERPQDVFPTRSLQTNRAARLRLFYDVRMEYLKGEQTLVAIYEAFARERLGERANDLPALKREIDSVRNAHENERREINASRRHMNEIIDRVSTSP
jgi:hypothetical protein